MSLNLEENIVKRAVHFTQHIILSKRFFKKEEGEKRKNKAWLNWPQNGVQDKEN